MKYSKAIIFLFIMAFVSPSQAEIVNGQESWELWEKLFASENKNWKLLKDKNGVKVYSHPVDISPINAFKGVTYFETDVSSLTALILDAESYPSWMRLTNVSEIVKKISNTEHYQYTVNKIMWPIKPRDTGGYMKGFYHPETGTVEIRFKHKPDLVPPNKKYVRIPIIIGHYSITPKPGGKVEFVFEAVTEVGGWIPTWAINFYLVNIPLGTFNSIRKIMPLEKYKGHTYDFTKDFAFVK